MNKIKFQFFLTFFFISNLSYAALFLAQTGHDGLSNALASASPSNSPNIISEGNSTFSNSTTEGDDNQQNIATVIVIPNPNSDSKPTTTTTSASNTTTLETNQSDLVNLTDTNTNPQKNQQSTSVNSSSASNEMQRGEYLVDNNGIHYYNINNCSLVKGSSGIGDLSECEDAEREIQEELTG